MLKRLITTMMAAAFAFAIAVPVASIDPAYAGGSEHWSGDGHGDGHWKKGGHGHGKKYWKKHGRKHWKNSNRGYRHGYKHAHKHWRKRHAPRYSYYREDYRHKHNRYYRRSDGLDLSGISGGNIIGAILGAAAGTQIGSGSGRTAAIIGGTVIGAIIGGEVEHSLSRADRQNSYRALERARDGETVAWRNPNTNARYQVTPRRTYKTTSNRYCREYTSWAFVNGYEEQVYGKACRMPDGSWKIVE